MKVILVDDEPTMHLILRKMLMKLPGVQVAGAFADTKAAAAFLRENSDVGLAFVDISMPGESGLAFAAMIEQTKAAVQVVLVTSHKEFALQAYDLSVLDYLIKPVSQERLARAVGRAFANPRTFQQPTLRSGDPPDAGNYVVTALGDVAVRSESGGVKWISRKCAELFAYLLLHLGKRIPRSRLIADIFGGMYPSNAESYLNTTVYQLRKSLEPLGLREAVRSENDGYALELKEPVIDYVEFARQAEEMKVIEEEDVGRAQRIERLYTGDLFGDKAYVWAVHETERYAELYATFVKRLANTLIALRDTAAASKLLLKLSERNPLDESVTRLLMTIRGREGDKKGLTAVYTDYVRLLGRELGIRPTEELIRFYDASISRLSDKK